MKKLVQSLFVIMALIGFTSLSAKAELFPTDGSAITLGETYQLEAYKSYSATVVITESGVMLQDGGSDLEIEGLEKSYVGYGSYGQIWSWNVEAGNTYTIEAGFVMSAGSVAFTMESQKGLELVLTNPAANEVLAPNSNGTGTIDLVFGSTVKFDEAYLVVGDKLTAIPSVNSPDNYLSLDVSSAMKNMYNDELLNPDGGTALTLKVVGLRTASGVLYNGDGNLEIPYVASARLADIVSYKIPDSFKSYFVKGNTDGVCEFVFDRDLANDGSIIAVISCGDPETSYYTEEITPVVNGSTITVDLCGKLRDLNSYASDVIQLRISNVKDINGLATAGSGQGSQASYSFYMPYEYVAPVNIVSEFTPASGSSLKGVKEIEIWFNNASAITFDGVKITYSDGGVEKTIVIPNADLNIQTADNDVTVTFAVPAELEGKDKICVSLDNVVSSDGHDYGISAEYDQFVAQLLSPIKPGEAIASTGDDDFVFNLNIDNTILYVRYDFYNGEGESGWAYGTQLNKQANGTYTAYNGNYVCYSNFDPYMIVSAYYNENNYYQGIEAVSTYRFDFKGTTKPFEFSDVKFVSIDPENESTIEPYEDFCWTITFDGIAVIDQAQSGIADFFFGLVPFERVEAIDPDDEGLSYQWRLYPGESALENVEFINLNIVAEDINGMRIEGNEGEGEYSSLQFSYSVYNEANLKELTVTPAPYTTVEEVHEFTVTAPGTAVTRNYNYNTAENGMPTLSNMNMEVLYTFTEDDIKEIFEQTGVDDFGQPVYSLVNKVVLTTPETYTEGGSYILYIPEAFFLVGTEIDTHPSAAFFGSYRIPFDPIEITVSPEGGEVTSLTRIDIDGPGIEDAGVDYNADPITITDANGKVVYTATPDMLDATSFDWDSWSFLGYYLEPNITEPGTYVLNIPAGFLLFDFGENVNKALEVVYNLTTTGITSVAVEKADSYTVYTISGVLVLNNADANALSTLAPGFYVINGKKVLVK